MKILVTGDRNWTNVLRVREVLATLPPDTVLVHGAARGADTIAETVAKSLGFTILRYPAQWKKFGRPAGPIRNREMLDKNKDIDIVIGFHNDIENSKGTKDMLDYAKSRGKRCVLYTEEGRTEW